MKIIIGGVSYDVTFEKSRSKIADNEPIGQIDYLSGKIQVFKKMSECRIRRALMHEIVHGVVTNYSIQELRHPNGDHNEVAIDLLAIGIVEAIESMGLYLPTSDSQPGGQMLDSLIKLIKV